MSKESEKSTPVPTPREDEKPGNQTTEVTRTKPKFNVLAIVIIIIVALVLIAFFAGYL